MYDAVVDTSGQGDYTTVGAAVTAGAQSIFIRNGTYNENAIALSDGAFLLGETAGAVILDFGAAAASLTADGNGGTKETAGTIAVTNGSTAVVGTGTTFTNLSAGDYILIGCVFYEIDTITNDTNLDLVEAYEGVTASGLSYQAHTMFSGVQMENIVVQNSTSNGLLLRACRASTLTNVEANNCSTGVAITDCGETVVTSLRSQFNTVNGVTVTDSYALTVVESELTNNTQHGIQVAGTSNCINLVGCNCNNNDDDGVHVTGTSQSVHLTNCQASMNVINGVETTASVLDVTVVAGTASSNGNDGLSNVADQFKATGCTTNNNGRHGIYSNGDDGILTSNNSTGNTSSGILLDTGCQRTIVSSNNVRANTGTNLSNTGLSNVITGNVTL